MRADNIRKLLIGILLVSALLSICVALDYADEDIIVSNNTTVDLENYTLINGTSNIKGSIKTDGKIHTIKKAVGDRKLPTISITAKPSCSCKFSYRWRTSTFVNYCPHCRRYGVLTNKHKGGARFEQELTCKYDDCDYCGVCGKEKYSWSSYRLIKV